MIYSIYSISQETIIKSNVPHPNLGEGAVIDLDSDLLILKQTESPYPSYNPDTQELSPVMVIDLESNECRKEWAIVDKVLEPKWKEFWDSFLLPENIDFYNRIVFVSRQYNAVDVGFSLVKESINTTQRVSALISARDFLRDTLQEVNADFAEDEIQKWDAICENCNLGEAKITMS